MYQSRSGPASQPWLEPDILDYLREYKARAEGSAVVIAPIGFVSDHMEILFDLDTQARELCDELGLHMVRAETVGTHPRFIRMIRELICERLDETRAAAGVGFAAAATGFLSRGLLSLAGATGCGLKRPWNRYTWGPQGYGARHATLTTTVRALRPLTASKSSRS